MSESEMLQRIADLESWQRRADGILGDIEFSTVVTIIRHEATLGCPECLYVGKHSRECAIGQLRREASCVGV